MFGISLMKRSVADDLQPIITRVGHSVMGAPIADFV